MFRCVRAPLEPGFTPDLLALGFKPSAGQIVEISPPHNHFEYYHTDNERANDLRKEATHEAVRKMAAEQLAQLGIHQLHLTGDTFTSERPDGPHVTIFANEVSQLRSKNDVVLVIGEASGGQQDGGVFAWRILMRDGGFEKGTAVGLAEKMMARGQARKEDGKDGSKEAGKEDDDEDLTARLQGLSVQASEDPDTPGLIILNPGQLIYSHAENKPMSQTTWLARSRPGGNALAEPYLIDDAANKVHAHKNPFQHISTCIEKILPRLLNKKARLHIIAIGDSASKLIEVLDNIFLQEIKSQIEWALESVIFIDPDEANPDFIESMPLRTTLQQHGRSWVKSSSVPYGQLVNHPVTHVNPDFRSNAMTNGHGQINDPSTPPTRSTSGEQDADDAHEHESDYVNVASVSQPPFLRSHPAEPRTPPRQIISTADVAEEEAIDESSFVDVDHEGYREHGETKVVCPTFSAGTCDFITETVFPAVMDDALEFIWQRIGEAEEIAEVRAKFAVGKLPFQMQ